MDEAKECHRQCKLLYEKAVEIEPNEEAIYVLARFLVRGPDAELRENERATQILTRLIDAGRDSRMRRGSSCRCLLGIAQLQAGRISDAISSFNQSLDMGFDSAWEKLGLSIAYAQLGDIARARFWFSLAERNAALQENADLYYFWLEASELIDTERPSSDVSN